VSFTIAEDDLSGSDVRAHGFVDCPPFADYRPDPFSRFMTLEL
jgi:hypothetical protein